MDSDSWEAAEADLFIEEDKTTKTKRKVPLNVLKVSMLHQVLYVINLLNKRRIIKYSEEKNEYEAVAEIKAEMNSLKNTEFLGLFNQPSKDSNIIKDSINNNIEFFLSLNYSKVPAKIYFVFTENYSNQSNGILSFVEYQLNGNIVKNKALYDGNVLSINSQGIIEDSTAIFGRKFKYHRIFCRIIKSLSACLPKESIFKKIEDAFDSDQRIKNIPPNITKLKIHPLYCAESLCRPTEFIYPKRPLIGFIKGEAIYPRTCLKTLKTEKGYYRVGKILNGNVTPYRIYNGKKLFADFQTKDIVIPDITGKRMDYFHDNFIPLNCCYIDYPPDICKELGISYSECFIGFKGREPEVRGFFVQKKYCYELNRYIKEDCYYKNVHSFIESYEGMRSDLDLLIKKIRNYHKIRIHLGIDSS